MLNRSAINLIFSASNLTKLKCLNIQQRNLRGVPSVAQLPTSKIDKGNFRNVLDTVPDGEYLDTIAPSLPKSFNLAAYANQSQTLQKLIQIGVDLRKIEKKGLGQYYAELDFDKDVKDIVIFLNDLGVDPSNFGQVITKNPFIFGQTIENLEKRITYFKSKKFSDEEIASIVTRAPLILSYTVKAIDSALGFLQKEFGLNGDQVRHVVVKYPKILLNKFLQTKEISFTVKEELGFKPFEAKELLLKLPKIWCLSRKELTERLDYLHNEIGIAHEDILNFPGSLLRRKFLVVQRHQYLVTLGRAQYDKTKANYVSLIDLCTGDDVNFCQNVAKTSVQDFNQYLKTL